MARYLMAVVVGVVGSALSVCAPASAASITPGTYRVFWEPRPNHVVLPQAAVTRPSRGGDDTVDVHQWEFVAVDYRPAGPVFQMRNAASRLCLVPSRSRPGVVAVEQNACGVGDSGLWYVAETGGHYRITLASNPRTALYGAAVGSSEPSAAVGQVGDEPTARWILEPLEKR